MLSQDLLDTSSVRSDCKLFFGTQFWTLCLKMIGLEASEGMLCIVSRLTKCGGQCILVQLT